MCDQEYNVSYDGSYWIVRDMQDSKILSQHLTELQALDRARQIAQTRIPSRIRIQRAGDEHVEVWSDTEL